MAEAASGTAPSSRQRDAPNCKNKCHPKCHPTRSVTARSSFSALRMPSFGARHGLASPIPAQTCPSVNHRRRSARQRRCECSGILQAHPQPSPTASMNDTPGTRKKEVAPFTTRRFVWVNENYLRAWRTSYAHS